MDFSLDNMEDLYIIDESPFWGRRLIEVCDGFGPISFTDAWTLTLEHFLWHDHKINRTIFLDKLFDSYPRFGEGCHSDAAVYGNWLVYRRVNPSIDQQSAPRWATDRAHNFNVIASTEYREMVRHQAEKVANLIGKQ